MALLFEGERWPKCAISRSDCLSKRRALFCRFWDKWDKKDVILKKRTWEVIENRWLATKNEPERTEKRSGEVVENTYLQKNEPKNEPGHIVENKG